jgi:hypothetical protein
MPGKMHDSGRVASELAAAETVLGARPVEVQAGGRSLRNQLHRVDAPIEREIHAGRSGARARSH